MSMKCFSMLSVGALVLLGVSFALAQSETQIPLQAVAPWAPEHQQFEQSLKDVLFDFDVHENALEQEILHQDAQWLKEHPSMRFYVNGYTDHRGDVLYNLVLAQRRADTVKAELVKLGVPENQLVLAAGWGELYPTCREQTESCFQQNRRVHFVFAPGS